MTPFPIIENTTFDILGASLSCCELKIRWAVEGEGWMCVGKNLSTKAGSGYHGSHGYYGNGDYYGHGGSYGDGYYGGSGYYGGGSYDGSYGHGASYYGGHHYGHYGGSGSYHFSHSHFSHGSSSGSSSHDVGGPGTFRQDSLDGWCLQFRCFCLFDLANTHTHTFWGLLSLLRNFHRGH